MHICNFDKNTLSMVRSRFEKLAKEFQEETGIALKMGNIRYDSNSFTTKLQGYTTVVHGDGEVVSPDKIEWDKNCEYFGFSKQDFGRTFKNLNGTYKIVGIKTRNRKYPIICEKNGKNRYKMTVEQVKFQLGNNPSAT